MKKSELLKRELSEALSRMETVRDTVELTDRGLTALLLAIHHLKQAIAS